jgi:uncharacterized Ntn-hydrolase superfamily protein
MTFSLIARCSSTGMYGVAAATAMPAVGKLLTHAHPRTGAIATQARLNPYLGIDGIRLLKQGRTAEEVLQILSANDPRAEARQFAVIDREGRTAAWTGKECIDWAGHLSGDGFSTKGNRLAGREVLEAAAQAFRDSAGKPLDERFMEALEAGDRAGGDTEGEKSATIYIVDREEYPLWDIRVDAHPDPFAELRRLHDIFDRELLPEIRRMPTRRNPAGSDEEHQA